MKANPWLIVSDCVFYLFRDPWDHFHAEKLSHFQCMLPKIWLFFSVFIILLIATSFPVPLAEMELQIMKQPALCFKCGFRHPQSYLFSGLICIDDDLDSSLSQTFCHRLSVQFLFNFNSPLFPFLKNVFLTATFPVRPLYVFMWIQINRKRDVFLCITEGHSAANLCGMRTVSSPGGLLINTSFSDFNPRNTENVKNLPSKQNKQKQCIQKD